MTLLKRLNPIQRLFRLIQIDKKEIYQVYIYALFNGLVNLSMPLGIQAIINLIQGAEVSTAWIVLVSFVILGVLFTGILQMLQLRLVEDISQKIFNRASFEFAYRIPKIQFKELYNYYAPELANRFFDTITIQKGLPKLLIDFSLAAFQILVGLIVLSLYHPFFVIFGLLLIVLVYSIIAISGPLGLKTSLQESKYKYQVAHWLEEIARTKLSFKLTHRPEISLKKTDEFVSSYLKSRENHFRILIRQFIALVGFKVLIAAGLLIIGSLLVFQQQMNIGQFVAAEIIILLIMNSVEKLIQSLDSIYDVLTALEKIGYVTDMKLDKDDGICIPEEVEEFSLEARDLCFEYPDSRHSILHNVNLKIEQGESVLISGPAGSGKSTLIGLLSGILEPTDGVIKYNGFPMQSLDFESLKRHIGYAVSNHSIFLGSLLENITMGKDDIAHDNIMKTIKIVHLEDFVAGLKDGLDTELDPEAKRIPRSVSNKIVLARAIINKPKLLILEDPLDHVPVHEKRSILEALTEEGNPWSIIVSSVDMIWRDFIPREIDLDSKNQVK